MIFILDSAKIIKMIADVIAISFQYWYFLIGVGIKGQLTNSLSCNKIE
jgi:hypothetical protein